MVCTGWVAKCVIQISDASKFCVGMHIRIILVCTAVQTAGVCMHRPC